MHTVAPLQRTDEEIEKLETQLVGADANRFVELAVNFFAKRVAMTTSFGIDSAVMLHLVTRVRPNIPVIWIDTGYLFPETYRYAEELTSRLNLNLKVYQSSLSPARMEALHGRLWTEKTQEALDRYHMIRKVEPLQRALKELTVAAWFTGLRSSQTDYRRSLTRIHRIDGRYRLLPILDWSPEVIEDYLKRNELPTHPLRAKGFVSVGDWHASRALSSRDTSQRATRFHGLTQECGIHLPLSPEAEESLRSSSL